MRTRLVLVTTLCLLFSLSVAAQPNILDDPGFAVATTGTPMSNSNWSLIVNLPDGIDHAAEFHDAGFASDPADVGNTFGVWFRPFEGGQNPGDPLAQAELAQVVSNVGGGDYSLTFSVKREAFMQASAWVASLSSSGTGGGDQIDLLASVPNDGTWVTRMMDLSGVSPGDDLTVSIFMTDGQVAPANPQSGFVDNFRLVPRGGDPVAVPALGGVGLGLLAIVLAATACWRLRY